VLINDGHELDGRFKLRYLRHERVIAENYTALDVTIQVVLFE
jgi:hypothetical protein